MCRQRFQNVSLRALDVGLLQAGASYRGEFEKRLRQVIDEVHASEKPIILFIDEAHMLIGAGGPAGTGDAANLLKPALARGTLRTIAATTWGEYKKIEEDPALTRRFQVVQIHEPNEEKAIRMIRGMASVMEHHHRVQVLDEALEAAVGLSHRYIPARQLPDKAVSLLDTACARVAISQQAVPAEVDDCRQRISALETELEIMAREKHQPGDVPSGRLTSPPDWQPNCSACSNWRHAGPPKKPWSIRFWRSASVCAPRQAVADVQTGEERRHRPLTLQTTPKSIGAYGRTADAAGQSAPVAG